MFISGFILSISLCLDFGIVNAAMIKISMERGFSSSLKLGLGSTVGDLIYAGLSTTGIGLLITNHWVRLGVWIGGSIVLLFFCIKIFIQTFFQKTELTYNGTRFTKIVSGDNHFIYGIILALSSPTAILWYFTIGGSIIATLTLQNNLELIFFLAGFGTASVLWSMLISWAGHKSGVVFNGRSRKILSLISAFLFFVLAIIVFIKGYRTLI